MNKDNENTNIIPRYKFGTYHGEYDWFIIDTKTDKIVEELKNASLTQVRLLCREWNNNSE